MCNEHCENMYNQVSTTKHENYPILILLSGKGSRIKLHQLIEGSVYVFLIKINVT